MVSTTGAGADYGYAAPLAPGPVDPVRLAALVEGIECGGLVWDPAEEALFGPDPDVDAAALFAALDADAEDADAPDQEDGPAEAASGLSGMVDPAVLVPARMPGLDDLAPGVDLAGMLDGADLAGLGAYEVVETIAGWQRMASWAAARQAAAITELTRRAEMRPVQPGRAVESMSSARITGTEVAARLTLTPHQGDGLTARALCWCEDLPATREALEAGRIDLRRAEVIADTLRGHSLQLARRVEAEVLGRAGEMTAPRLRRAIIQALHRLAPDTGAPRPNAARTRSRRWAGWRWPPAGSAAAGAGSGWPTGTPAR